MIVDLIEFAAIKIVDSNLHFFFRQILDRLRLHLLDLEHERREALVTQLLYLIAEVQLHLSGHEVLRGSRLIVITDTVGAGSSVLLTLFLLGLSLARCPLAGARSHSGTRVVRRRDDERCQTILLLELLQLSAR